jgi:N-acetyl-anhydromuramyl-L-alanine amidase AmpD
MGNNISSLEDSEKTGEKENEPDWIQQDIRLSYVPEEIIEPTGIIIHCTEINSLQASLKIMEQRRVSCQFMIDLDGTIYQLMTPINRMAHGCYGGNRWGINIELVGTEKLILEKAQQDQKQIEALVRLLHYVGEKFHIPLSNAQEGQQENHRWRGIFSHQQVNDYHPLSLARSKRPKKIDPGEEYMKLVLEHLHQWRK